MRLLRMGMPRTDGPHRFGQRVPPGPLGACGQTEGLGWSTEAPPDGGAGRKCGWSESSTSSPPLLSRPCNSRAAIQGVTAITVEWIGGEKQSGLVTNVTYSSLQQYPVGACMEPDMLSNITVSNCRIVENFGFPLVVIMSAPALQRT
jgi:hypothetical protein